MFILYNPKGSDSHTQSTIKDVAQKVFLLPSLFIAEDERVLKKLGIESRLDQSHLIVVKDGMTKEYRGTLDNHDTIRKWLVTEQHPLYVEHLDKDNSGDLFYNTDYLVLAAVDPSDPLKEEYIESMRTARKEPTAITMSKLTEFA